MEELGIDINEILEWFPHESETPYVLVRVDPKHAGGWTKALIDAIRRCYLTDEFLKNRALELESALGGTLGNRQAHIVNSKLPDAGSTMAGDFGEILVYLYQSAKAHPRVAFGPKKWRLKENRTKAAPYSDVVQFILPTWPMPSDQDEIHCAEVKLKSTASAFNPIAKAIEGCTDDRTSRLAKTLQWLKARAIGESLGNVQIAHLDRFIHATDYPPVTKRYRAVAVICSSLVDAELANAPAQSTPDYSLVVIAVPQLHTIYNATYVAAKTSVPIREKTS